MAIIIIIQISPNYDDVTFHLAVFRILNKMHLMRDKLIPTADAMQLLSMYTGNYSLLTASCQLLLYS